MKQLFMLPELDREKTKEAVEKALENYKLFLLSIPDEKIPKVTANYSFEVPPTFGNGFHSSTEDTAIEKVDKEREREKYINWVRKAVNKLNFKEREMIIKRYLSDEEIYDYEIYNEMGMSERKFYRFKARAFYKLAFALKVEVYSVTDDEFNKQIVRVEL
ncbi:phage transcriptional regulator, ArpU family [Neobacillus massiliamazoniensis]|uniref:Phage transcriptional regulator, ArpU family n=2 Tax=Neobacillus massiliamazoniensis TaxID=1499688 RepID=A0A0U1NQK4_9BACI|nr:ArpU family phage packaging/lysis transcriptional regulator [Neobacillus massiliamazoniensis]CRK80326.1 phage transcriptional regulator, ArpU family [Neobacillus massiliamazoniensis]